MGMLSKFKDILFYGYANREFLDKPVQETKSYSDRSFILSLDSSNKTSITNGDVLEQPYVYHDLVHSLCESYTVNIAKVKWNFVNQYDEVIENHPLIDLFEDPNPLLTKSEFIEKIILGLLLPSGKDVKNFGGQVFILGKDLSGNYVDFTSGKIPAMLEVLYEKGEGYSIAAKIEAGEFKGWEYKKNNISKILEFGEVIRIRKTNPVNDFIGLSSVTPAIRKLNQDVLSDDYNSSFFENDARVAALITTKDAGTTEEQMNKIMKMWYNTFQGNGKHHKVGFAPAEVEYKELANSHKDMDFIEQKKNINDSIIGALRLNKIATGRYEDVNFATISYGHKLLWEDSYLPLIRKIEETLNSKWLKYVKGDIKIKADLNDIEPLQKDYSNQSQAYATYVNTGMPPVLAARLLNIPFTEEDIKNYPFLEERNNPYGNMFNEGTEETTEETTEESPEEENDVAENEDKKALQKEYFKKKSLKEHFAFTKAYYNNVTKANELNFAKLFAGMLDKQKKEMLSKVNLIVPKSKVLNKEISKADVDKILFDKVFWDKQFKRLYKAFIPRILKSEKAQLSKESKGLINWNYSDSTISSFVKKRNKLLSEITTTTFDSVKSKLYKIVESGKLDNMTINESAKEIEDTIGDSIKARGGNIQTIARTEVTTIQTYSRVDAFEKADIEWVEWSPFEDEKTRPEHLAAGQDAPQKMGSVFPSVNLRYPHDPNGAPEQVINCRCVLIASEKNLDE